MKTLSGALSAALGAPVQKPALLVKAHFGTVRYWSSHATAVWNAQTWQATAMQIEALLVRAFSVSGTLVLANGDGVAGALVLGEGVQDRRFELWGYDAAALTTLADAVWLGDAVGAAAEVGNTEVRIALRHRTEFVQSPRTYVTAAAGFTHLVPAGTVLRINGIDMRLERR